MVEIIKKSINHHWLTLPLQQRPDNYSYNFRNSLRKSWICFRTAENPTSFHFNILLLLSNSLHRGIWNSQVRSPVLVEIRRWLGLKVKLSHSRFSRKPDVKDLDSFRLICISSISYTHLLYIYNHLHMSTKLNKCFFQYITMSSASQVNVLMFLLAQVVKKKHNSCSSIGVEMMSPKGPTYQFANDREKSTVMEGDEFGF